jgi:hypothetical protein
MNKENNPIGYVEQAQIDAWKEKYKLKYIPEITTVDEEDQEHVTYVKKPNLELLQLLANKAKVNQEIKGLEMVFQAVRIGGSEEVLVDEDMKYDAMIATGKLFRRKEAKLKKR